MKKKSLFNNCRHFLIVFGVFFSFYSCSTEVEDTNVSIKKNVASTKETKDNEAFFKFVASMDSINQQFSFHCYPITRGKPVRGSQFVVKYGWKALSAVVDGCASVIGTAATGGFGGLLIGTAASWLYDAHIERINKKLNTRSVTHIADTIRFSPPTCMAFMDKEHPTIEDSLGYIHNQVLADLDSIDHIYINDNGFINYHELLMDCASSLKKYGVDCRNIMVDMNLVDKLKNVIQSTVFSFYKYGNDDLTYEGCFSNIQETLTIQFGNSSPSINILQTTQSKLLDVIPELSETEVKDYAAALNVAINNSDLAKGQKKEIKQTCDVTINSKLYWSAVNP